MKKFLFAFCLSACSALATLALASPGHDHGDESVASDAPASPRVVMEADFFEAVAILKGHTLEIFIDHATTNKPVENADLAMLLNGEKVPLELHDVGEFDAAVPDSMKDKNLDVALRVTVGEQSEVLTGRLEVGDDHDHEEEVHSHLPEYVAIAVTALVVFFLIALVLKRRKKGVN